MANDNIEIEIQVNVEKSKPLLDFLKKNAKFQDEKRQMDEYFTPAHKNYVETRPVKEWLRLRDADGKYFITYKNWHYTEKGEGTHADEYETEVKDIKAARKILDSLDCKPIVKVDKIRKTWIYEDFEIAMDSVKGLDDSVEIEYCGSMKGVDPRAKKKEMIAFLKEIGCGKLRGNHGGYAFLLLFPEEAEYIIH